MILENLWPFQRNGGECTGVRRVSRAGGCWWCNLCLERLLDSDLPVVPHLPNLAHRHTDNNNLSLKTILPEKEATTKFNCLFQGDFYPQQPLTRGVDLALLATPPPIKKVPALAGDKKRAHPFLPDVFLYKRTITAANVP